MDVELLALQAFTGLSIFTILMLMALGLSIIFGLMGVINMAHGELMAMGAYTTYGTSLFFEAYFPDLMGIYFIVGIILAFCFVGGPGINSAISKAGDTMLRNSVN